MIVILGYDVGEIRGKEGSRFWFGLLVLMDELFLLADAGFG